MSGPICPDCSLYSFEEMENGYLKCRICGWNGNNLPRKIMASNMVRSKSERMSQMLKLRQEGNLFYFKIDLMGTDVRKGKAKAEIMSLFNLSSMSGFDRLIFYLTEDPGQDKLRSLEQIKEVENVLIF